MPPQLSQSWDTVGHAAVAMLRVGLPCCCHQRLLHLAQADGHLMQVTQMVVHEHKLVHMLQNHQQRHAPDHPVPLHTFQNHLLSQTSA